MSHSDVFPASREWAAKAWANAARYHAMYRRSVDDPEGFWGEQGKRLYDDLGDVSTLADPRVIPDLVDHRLAH
jgi:hypothetical protein